MIFEFSMQIEEQWYFCKPKKKYFKKSYQLYW